MNPLILHYNRDITVGEDVGGNRRITFEISLLPGVPSRPSLLSELATVLRDTVHQVARTTGGTPRLQAHIQIQVRDSDRIITVRRNGEHGRGSAQTNWERLTGNDIMTSMESFLKSGDNVTVSDIILRAVIPFEAILYGFGRGRPSKLEQFEERYCLSRALLQGTRAVGDIEAGNTRIRAKPRPKQVQAFEQRVIEQHVNLHWAEDGSACLDDISSWLKQNPSYKITVFVTTNNYASIKSYEGDEFDPNGLGFGNRQHGRHIYIKFDQVEEHFSYVNYEDIRDFQFRRNDRVRSCPSCSLILPYLNHADREAWVNHTCSGRSVCSGCHLLYSNARLKEHQKIPFTCSACSRTIYEGTCAKIHVESGLCKASARYCVHCKVAHDEDEPCFMPRCPGCKKKIHPWEILVHRCYIPKNNHKQKEGLFASEEVNDNEAEDTVPSLECVWVGDMECAMRPVGSAIKALPLTSIGTVDIAKQQVMEHIPILVGIKNLGTGQVLTWGKPEQPMHLSDKPIEQFLRFFINSRNRPKGHRAKGDKAEKHLIYFHNGGRYDTQLILAHVMAYWPAGTIRGNPIVEGMTIKQLELGSLRILDSYLQLPKALAKLPDMLNLQVREGKGRFPYTFCTMQNLTYAGPMPSAEEFGLQKMNLKQRQEFGIWYKTEKEKVNNDLAQGGQGWVLWDKLLEYFGPDLDIPAAALIKYSEICENLGILNPLGKITLAANALTTFRKLCMPVDSIPILRNYRNYAGGNLHNAYNEEKCCRDAYAGGRTGPSRLHYKLTPEQIRQGYRIRILDVTSMYPSVMVNHPFPTGNGKFTSYLLQDPQPTTEELFQMHGVACLEIEHPTGLYTPLLWRRRLGANGMTKLVFDNEPCLKPFEIRHWIEHIQNKNPCPPPCSLCSRLGTYHPAIYVFPEIREALKAGYQVKHIYWTLTFPDVRNDIFDTYYGKTFGMKCKYSKAPNLDWEDVMVCETYRHQMWEKARISIPANINPKDWHTPNSGMKEVGKIYANSLYGKLGASPYKREMTIVDDPDKEMDMLRTRDPETLTSFTVGGKTVFQDINYTSPGLNYCNTNVLVAAYVTAYARIKLWKMMSHFGENLLYVDTDSVFVVETPFCKTPPEAMGPYLGDWTDDVSEEIGEYVCIGPKSYMVKDINGKVIKSRFKGVSMSDARNHERLTFEWMVWAQQEMRQGRTVHKDVHDFIMRFNLKTLQKISQESVKRVTASPQYLKGLLAPNGQLYPFGSERLEKFKHIIFV